MTATAALPPFLIVITSSQRGAATSADSLLRVTAAVLVPNGP